MKKYILLLLLIMQSLPGYSQIYKWTDRQGTVHFSDRPHPDAEEIEISDAQTFSSPPVQEIATDTATEPDKVNNEKPDYDVTLIEPKDQDTIRDSLGTIPVKIQVMPDLAENDKLQIILNGQAYGEPQATTNFHMTGIERGSHTLAAQLLDSEGNVIKTTETITVFMHPPRVGMVPQTRPNN
jgi:hypothetical protein